jgi:hypothetical protein
MGHADGISARLVDHRLKPGDLFGVFVVIDEPWDSVAHVIKMARSGSDVEGVGIMPIPFRLW